MWYCYMVLCRDNTLYTGSTDNPLQRVGKHNNGTGAKYTKARRPVTLVYLEECGTRSDACKREWTIKKLTREQKLQLMNAYEKKEEGNHGSTIGGPDSSEITG